MNGPIYTNRLDVTTKERLSPLSASLHTLTNHPLVPNNGFSGRRPGFGCGVAQRRSIKDFQVFGTLVGFMFASILGLLPVAGCYFIGLSQFMW